MGLKVKVEYVTLQAFMPLERVTQHLGVEVLGEVESRAGRGTRVFGYSQVCTRLTTLSQKYSFES